MAAFLALFSSNSSCIQGVAYLELGVVEELFTYFFSNFRMAAKGMLFGSSVVILYMYVSRIHYETGVWMCVFLKAGFLYSTVPIVTTGLPEACLVYNLKALDTVYFSFYASIESLGNT